MEPEDSCNLCCGFVATLAVVIIGAILVDWINRKRRANVSLNGEHVVVSRKLFCHGCCYISLTVKLESSKVNFPIKLKTISDHRWVQWDWERACF